MMIKLFSCATLLATAYAEEHDECCSKEGRASRVEAGKRCAPLDDNGYPLPDSLHCSVCWDQSTGNGVLGVDASLPGCSGATDTTGELCIGGFCEEFASTQTRCIRVQCTEFAEEFKDEGLVYSDEPPCQDDVEQCPDYLEQIGCNNQFERIDFVTGLKTDIVVNDICPVSCNVCASVNTSDASDVILEGSPATTAEPSVLLFVLAAAGVASATCLI